MANPRQAGLHRPARVRADRRRPLVTRAWPPRSEARKASGRPCRQPTARVRRHPRTRIPGPGRQWPIEVEVLRAVLLIALVIVFIAVLLPSLLALAGRPVR